MPRLPLILLLSALSPANTPERPGPSSTESVITSVVASLLEHQHLDGSRLDDDVSREWFTAYLDALDPMHMYFTQADIDGFKTWETSLDDNLHRARPSDLAPAFEIFDVYTDRVNERAIYAIEIADDPVDYTIDEDFDTDRRDDPWPATDAERDDLWRRYIKLQRLRGELAERDAAEETERIVKRYHDLQRSMDEMESFDVLEIYLSALAEVHDPHSSYMKPANKDNFDIDLSNSVEGIGAVLRRDDEYTKIVELVPGGPAETSGELQPGDRIVAVAQGRGEPVSILDQRIDKVVKLIRGKKGSEVRLTVIPKGAPDATTKIVNLVRDRVQLENSLAKMEIEETADGKVAVIDVPSFYAPVQGHGGVSRVSADVREHLDSLPDDVEAVVIDLRWNTGGSLAEAIDLTGLFIDRGPVVQVRGRRGEVEVYRDRDGGTSWDGPLVVLTSPLSASASEIFAGAIQDYGRGVIVGSKQTHGKGTVQTVVLLDRLLKGMVDGIEDTGAGMLKLTTQQFYRVNGASTQARGVAADIALPTWGEAVHEYEGSIPHALEWDQVEPAPLKPAGDLTDVIPELRKRALERVAADEDLTAFVRANEWQEARPDGLVSLVKAERVAEQEEFDGLVNKVEDDEGEDGEELDERDAQLEQALKIATDLADLTG